jgi:hypothetical protein
VSSSRLTAVVPMHPTLVREPFHRDGWIYEEKYDGWRMLAYKDGQHVRLACAQAPRSSRNPLPADDHAGTSAFTRPPAALPRSRSSGSRVRKPLIAPNRS